MNILKEQTRKYKCMVLHTDLIVQSKFKDWLQKFDKTIDESNSDVFIKNLNAEDFDNSGKKHNKYDFVIINNL
jgi:hypothetical protein